MLNLNEPNQVLEELLKTKNIIKIDHDRFKYNPNPEPTSFLFEIFENTQKAIPDRHSINFIEAAGYFLTHHAKRNCTPSTFKCYSGIFKNHLIPFFKDIELKNISIEEIKNFIGENEKRGLNTKLTKDILALLAQILRYFENNGFIEKTVNFQVKNIHNPKRQTVRVLSESDISKMLVISNKEYTELYPILMMIIHTGLKRSEILALTKEYIDFESNKIHINKTFYQGKLLPIKCRSAYRTIELPIQLKTILKKLSIDKNAKELIFINTKYTAIGNDKKLRRQFEKLKHKLGLDRLKFDDLRHTYAYNALQSGMSIDYLHKQLGDYSIQATMDKYGDFIPNTSNFRTTS
jgi:integrase